jgi:DNA (cytosine-5)-methyltransferase 1
LEHVLRSLAEIGYDAEWHCIPASAVGAPHANNGRDRIWILAYPNSNGCRGPWLSRGQERKVLASASGSDSGLTGLPDAASGHWQDQPSVHRVVDGVSDRLDKRRRQERIKQLGNAVVPQVVEWIGRQLVRGLKEQDEQR